jgi:hypothetical protein
MSQLNLLKVSDELDLAFRALKADLLREGGPQISSIRNHRFAILPYPPSKEFVVRRRTRDLIEAMRETHGWHLETLSLRALLIGRLEARGEDFTDRIVDLESQLAAHSRPRAQAWLGSTLSREIEGPEGLAGDCARAINAARERLDPAQREKLCVLIGDAGPLYPYFRFSALLRYLAGNTQQVPVVLLYPGVRKGDAGLSFMGELPPDRSYRPRIYP